MINSHVELNIEERKILARLLHHKTRIAEIARVLSRHRSTIYREIRRNWWHDVEVPQADGYWPLTAQKLSQDRRRRYQKLVLHRELREALLHKSADGRTSPSAEQTYPATFVTGMPSAVNPFSTTTRTWNSAT